MSNETKTVPIKIKGREGNKFTAITRGGLEIKMGTDGENDPRFHILLSFMLRDKEMSWTFPARFSDIK